MLLLCHSRCIKSRRPPRPRFDHIPRPYHNYFLSSFGILVLIFSGTDWDKEDIDFTNLIFRMALEYEHVHNSNLLYVAMPFKFRPNLRSQLCHWYTQRVHGLDLRSLYQSKVSTRGAFQSFKFPSPFSMPSSIAPARVSLSIASDAPDLLPLLGIELKLLCLAMVFTYGSNPLSVTPQHPPLRILPIDSYIGSPLVYDQHQTIYRLTLPRPLRE